MSYKFSETLGRLAACTDKQKFDSRKKARAARGRTPATGHLNIYVCPFCDFYHLGHLPPDVRSGETDKDDWRRRRVGT